MNKEFPQGKENYCPKCYFEDDKVVLRNECKHRPFPNWWNETKQCIEANLENNNQDTFSNIMSHIRTLVEQENKQVIEKSKQEIIKEIGEMQDKDFPNETLKEIIDLINNIK